jgi:hypothetical protein
MRRRIALVALALLGGCAAPAPRPTRPPPPHLPPYASAPFEAFSRVNTVAIAQREWRAFGSVVNDNPPDDALPLPRPLRPDHQPGLWQRVADYWWFGQDPGAEAGGWSSRYDESGNLYPQDAPAWSAAFISYIMRTAGAGAGFVYSALHADYINAAARNEGVLSAERPESYPPQPGDLICMGRGGAKALVFDDLPTSRFFGHCDLVATTEPGQLQVIGGNVFGGVTLKHIPVTPQGTLAGPDGAVLDGRFPWFVVLRVRYAD